MPSRRPLQFGDYTWSKKKEDGVTPLQGIRNLVGDRVKINYAKGCSLSSLDTSEIAEAVEAARRSDVALVFVGSSSAAFVRHSSEPSTSGEGMDLSDISLTGAQEQLIKEVHAVGKPVVVVLVAGKPFAIPWVKESIPAVLAQWYAGEQEGNSIADILFGNVNPSGKLAFSFPQSTGHLPAYYNHLPTDKGYYQEPGTYEKPGRDYVFSNSAPLWAFGHGLSYTQFNYLKAATDKECYQPHDTITVTIRLENTGKSVGKEVVQVYMKDVVSSVMTPVKQLKGFAKLELLPGQTCETTIQLPVHELYLTDDWGNRYLEPGKFELQVGTASDHILFHLPIYVGVQKAGGSVMTDLSLKQRTDGNVIQVKGTVRDIQATPLSGVKVYSDDSSECVWTDYRGTYIIKVKDNGRLVFSKKGFATKTVGVEGQAAVSIQLAKGE